MPYTFNPFTKKLDAIGTASGGAGIATINSIEPNAAGNFTIAAGTNIAITGGTNSITIGSSQAQLESNYTSVSTTPYVVLTTDNYISVNTSSLAITIELPNAPATRRIFTIKDRTGDANTNNISITTVGGSVTIDGQTTYTLMQQYEAVDLLFNGTSYEVF